MPAKRKRSASKDKESQASPSIASQIADEVIALLQQHKDVHGPVEFHKSLQLLKKFLDEQLQKGHVAIFASRFMDRFSTEHARQLSNPRLALLTSNVECERYNMKHMDAELSTEKQIRFSWESDAVCVEFCVFLGFNGYTDGMGPHACVLEITILDKESDKGTFSSSIELDDYEDYEDLFTANMRKGDIREFDRFWRNLPQLSEILSSEPFADDHNRCNADDEEASHVPAAEVGDEAKQHLLDFLQHVICAMKSTHPFDADD